MLDSLASHSFCRPYPFRRPLTGIAGLDGHRGGLVDALDYTQVPSMTFGPSR
jgi:hypothetical protein